MLMVMLQQQILLGFYKKNFFKNIKKIKIKIENQKYRISRIWYLGEETFENSLIQTTLR